jgi:hypothetical protein
MMTMSTLTEEGVMAVKQTACDRLLNFRVDMKLAGKRVTDVLNRMHVAVPKPRDRQARPPVIPPSVAAARAAAAGAAAAAAAAAKRKTEKDLQEEHGGAGGGHGGGARGRGIGATEGEGGVYRTWLHAASGKGLRVVDISILYVVLIDGRVLQLVGCGLGGWWSCKCLGFKQHQLLIMHWLSCRGLQHTTRLE